MRFFSLYAGFLIFAGTLILFAGASRANDEVVSCYHNALGDYICPSGSNNYTNDGAGFDSEVSSDDVMGAGSPLLESLSSVSGVSSGTLSAITVLFDSLDASLQNAFLSEILDLLSGDADVTDILNLVAQYTLSQEQLESMNGVVCGGTGLNADTLSYAANHLALNI